MKVTAIKENLTSGLNIVQRALSSKSVHPILSGIYLEAKEGRLTMVATDTAENAGLRISATVPVEVIEEGNTVVNGKTFRDFVSRLPDTNLLFNNESYNGKDRMTINYGKNVTEMIGWPGYEFPEGPKVDVLHSLAISAKTLGDLVRQTSFAVRKEDLRPIFTGLYFNVEGEDLTIVGTDSFRLAVMKDKIVNAAGDSFGVIIPAKALQEVISIMSEDAIVDIRVTKHQVIFNFDNVEVVSQLIKGDFPPYKSAIPSSCTTNFSVERNVLKQSIERATLFSRDRDGTSIVRLMVENGVLSVKTNSEMGQVNEELEIFMEGDEVNILFNSAFLLDGLTKNHYDKLDIEMSGNLGPMVIRPKNDDRYLYLLLPLRQ